jgi:hypothetical protein
MVFLNCLIDESTAIEEQINKEAGLQTSSSGGGRTIERPSLNERFALRQLEDVEPTAKDLEVFKRNQQWLDERMKQRKELKLKKQQQKVGKR